MTRKKPIEEKTFKKEEYTVIKNPQGTFIQPNGLKIGTILGGDEPIIFDPTENLKCNWSSNIGIFGTSGSGKSITSNKLTSIIRMLDVQSIIIDVENEYTSLIHKLGGDTIIVNNKIDDDIYNTINHLKI